MADEDGLSSLQFGGYDSSLFKDPNSWPVYLGVPAGSKFWNFNIDGFKVGQGKSFSLGRPNGYYLDYYSAAVLDTSTSFIYAPVELYAPLMETLLNEVESFYKYGYHWTNCKGDGLESLYILAGGHYFEVPPSSYLIDAGNGYCVIGIQ